ncbi:MAG: lyase family protein, partial [Cyclobacteriaceae bacterium]|nr:lyase family protein [Cyclobacteriaceae bacterium]
MKKIRVSIVLTLLTLLCIQYTEAQKKTATEQVPKTRTEKDLLGEKQIPFDAYYGVQTLRALENFPISGVKTNFYPDYVKAYAIVKLAAARANTEVGRMKKEKLDAIEKACQAVIDGKYHDQFLTDLY